ncbi:uncharacterized protein LOC100202074 [Hydra vulgaris]|uniref:uncharacterized protein LOC100202074 n=1 Tax=Hydra vulgaris TaxID=6087 RepID=UPI001F5EC821|nr:uncharacterized protein LOC100202074 [Hydra vulgaris]
MSQWRGSYSNDERSTFNQNQRGGSGFGIAPLMRPVSPATRGSFYGGANSWSTPQAPRSQINNQNNARSQSVNRGAYRTPGRGEVIRMGPSKPLPTKANELNADDIKNTTAAPEIKKEDLVVKSNDMKKDPLALRNQEVDKKEEKKFEPMEDIKPIVETRKENPRITLDSYNSELHVQIEENGFVGSIMRGEGFEYMWGGVRASHGVIKGKVCFEVHLLEELKVNIADENDLYVSRVGWSIDGSDYQLGEDKFSWGYGGTAKSSNECKFRDYGKRFGVGDTVTCYVDLDASPKAIFYMVNGEYLGVAFRFTNELTKSQALFPHIACKNMKFRVNFGAQPPKFPLTNGFVLIQHASELISPPPGPTKPEEAEIIMMVGLPGSGKSYWCEKYASDHKEKKYYILGTNFIIDRMKVSNLGKKRNYHGRWEELIKRASAILNKLFDVAKTRPRNYILDQTNVYFTARRRKMESFRGYKRIAAVLINKPAVLSDRIEKQKKIEGKFIPDEAVLEMKKNFTLPEVGPSFDDVWYIEETMPMARELVENYRKEGDLKHGVKRSFPDKDDGRVIDDKKPRTAPGNLAPVAFGQHNKELPDSIHNRNNIGFQSDRLAPKPLTEVERSQISPRSETRSRSTSLKRSERQLDVTHERINSRDRGRDIKDERNERDAFRRDDRREPLYRESAPKEDRRHIASKDAWSDYTKGEGRELPVQVDKRDILPRDYRRDIVMRDDQGVNSQRLRDASERNDKRDLFTRSDNESSFYRNDNQGSLYRGDRINTFDNQRDRLSKEHDISFNDQSKDLRDSRNDDYNGMPGAYRDVMRDSVLSNRERLRGSFPSQAAYESYLRENTPYSTNNEYQDNVFRERDHESHREYLGRETRDPYNRDMYSIQERDLSQRRQDYPVNQHGSVYDGPVHLKNDLKRRPEETIAPLMSREEYRKLPNSATYNQRVAEADVAANFRDERYTDGRVADYRDVQRSSLFQDPKVYPKSQSNLQNYDYVGGSKSEDYSKQSQFSDIRYSDAAVASRKDPYTALNDQPLRKVQDSSLLDPERDQYFDQANSLQKYASSRPYDKQDKDLGGKYSYQAYESKSKDDGLRAGLKPSSYYDQVGHNIHDPKLYPEMSRNDYLVSNVKGYSLNDEYDRSYLDNRGIRNNKSDNNLSDQPYSRDYPDVKTVDIQRRVDSRWNERSGIQDDSSMQLKSRQGHVQDSLPSKYQSDVNARESLYKRPPTERYETSNVSLSSYTVTHAREDLRDKQLRNENVRYSSDLDYHKDQQGQKQIHKPLNDASASQSYQTQMTTSTANYQPVKYVGTSLSSQNYREQSFMKPNESLNQSAYNQYIPQANALSTSMPQKPNTEALPGSQSYEQQQQDYQKAYSQWYANYAQAFAQLAQQNVK